MCDLQVLSRHFGQHVYLSLIYITHSHQPLKFQWGQYYFLPVYKSTNCPLCQSSDKQTYWPVIPCTLGFKVACNPTDKPSARVTSTLLLSSYEEISPV